MKVEWLRIYHYRLPLTRPLSVPGNPHWEREGFMLEIGDEEGRTAWGEAAPLPGLSSENSATTFRLLLQPLQFLKAASLPETPHELLEQLARTPFTLPPGVQFGWEMALLNLLSARQGQPLARLFNPNPPAEVVLNALLTGADQPLPEEAQRLIAAGYPSLKIKVGRRPLEQDISTVRKIQSLLPDTITLRLDANRAWSLEQAVWFCRSIAPRQIEYLEEPLQPQESLAELPRRTGCSLALDESLQELRPETFRPFAGLTTVVLKPGFILTLGEALRWTAWSLGRGLRPVFSSSFYAGPATAFLAEIAAALAPAAFPQGLDPYRWLADDVLEDPLQIHRGRLHLADCREKAHRVQQNKLELLGEFL